MPGEIPEDNHNTKRKTDSTSWQAKRSRTVNRLRRISVSWKSNRARSITVVMFTRSTSRVGSFAVHQEKRLSKRLTRTPPTRRILTAGRNRRRVDKLGSEMCYRGSNGNQVREMWQRAIHWLDHEGNRNRKRSLEKGDLVSNHDSYI